VTAAERLAQLSKLSGVTAAAMLLSIGVGATTGQALVDYSEQTGVSAATHLLADKVSVQPQQFVEKHSNVGGLFDDAGTGYVKQDHAWVRVTKYSRGGVSVRDIAVAVSGTAALDATGCRSSAIDASVKVSCAATMDSCAAIVNGYNTHVSGRCSAEIYSVGCGGLAIDPKIDWLSADEIVIMVDQFGAH
jgi:hypothetical protein